jgi:hypothetical protein
MNSPASSSPQRAPVRQGIRLVALALLLGTVGFWAAKGAHRGWTQNQVPIAQKDEITGLDYVTYEKRYVPGIDVLVGGIGVAAGLFGISFFVQRQPKKHTS